MATTVAELKAKISVDGADKAKKDLKDVGDGADKAKSHLGGLGGSIGTLKDAFVGGLGAIGGVISGFLGYKVVGDVIDFVKDQVVDLFQQAASQQAVMAQTAAVIKSTGDASGMSAGQIGDLADSLARMTGISDDTIQSAENILLTFTNINSSVFPQTTQLVLDMATAMHEDFNSAAIQIGKALQDPIQGVTALRRVGVQLSAQQQDAIKHFVAVGNVAAAQKIVMGELTRELGGSAKAYGQTLPGQMARLGVSFDQMKEKIGLAVFPILQDLVNKYLMPAADWLGKQLPAAIAVLVGFINTTLVPAINAVMNSPVVTTIEGWAKSFAKTLPPAVDTASTALGEKGLTGAGNKASGSLKNVGGGAKTAGKDIDGFVGHVNKGIKSVMGLTDAIDPKGAGDTKSHALVPAMRRAQVQFNELDAAQKKSQQSSANSIPVLSGLGEAFGNLFEKAGQAKDAIGGFASDVGKRFPAAEPTIKKILNEIGDDFSTFTDGIHNIWDGLWGVISFPVKTAFHELEGNVKMGLDLLGGNWKQFRKDQQQMQDNLTGDLKDFGKSIIGILKGAFETVAGIPVAGFKAMWHGSEQAINSFKDNFSNWWTKTALPAIEQAIDNWSHMIQQYINDHMPKFPGISFPWQQRASGGPVSGDFLGAEKGVELLVTPGIYHAPPGSYVYNAQQTQQILSNGGGMGSGTSVPLSMGGGDTYNVTVYGADANSARDIARQVTRQINWQANLHS